LRSVQGPKGLRPGTRSFRAAGPIRAAHRSGSTGPGSRCAAAVAQPPLRCRRSGPARACPGPAPASSRSVPASVGRPIPAALFQVGVSAPDTLEIAVENLSSRGAGTWQ